MNDHPIGKRPPWWRPFARRRWDREFKAWSVMREAALYQGSDEIAALDAADVPRKHSRSWKETMARTRTPDGRRMARGDVARLMLNGLTEAQTPAQRPRVIDPDFVVAKETP